MRYIGSVVLILALTVSAFAGGNPNAQMYISFDPTGTGGLVHNTVMVPNVPVTAYVCVTELDMGMTGVSFALTDVVNDYPGMFAFVGFTNLLDVPVGDVFTGISLASSTCRTDEVVVVGSLFLIPTMAGDLCLEIKDHPDYPRWVIDCTDPVELDFYCVLAHGTIGAGVCPEGDCPDTPIEESTWGNIKALYK